MGRRPNARGAGMGKAKNLTSVWPGLEYWALPLTSCGNLGNLLTYLSFTVIIWKIRTPSSPLESQHHVFIMQQLQKLCGYFLMESLPQSCKSGSTINLTLHMRKQKLREGVPQRPHVTARISNLLSDSRVWYKLLNYIKSLAQQPAGMKEQDNAHFHQISLSSFCLKGHSNGSENSLKKPLIWSFPALRSF